MNLAGKRILLTGATGGIGQAIAKQLAAEGASLLLTARDAEALAAVAAGLPGNHVVCAADLSKAAERARLVDVVSEGKGLDVLINNAGSQQFGWFSALSEAAISRQLLLNLEVPVLLSHHLLPQLAASGEAVILNIGSTFGSIGHPGFSAYCASKFGLRGFSEALGRELADTGIRVSYLAPRATRTSLNAPAVNALNDALGTHSDSPEQVAAAVIRMLLDGSRRRHLGWPERFFAWLNQVLPAVVDRALRQQLTLIKRFALQQEITP